MRFVLVISYICLAQIVFGQSQEKRVAESIRLLGDSSYRVREAEMQRLRRLTVAQLDYVDRVISSALRHPDSEISRRGHWLQEQVTIVRPDYSFFQELLRGEWSRISSNGYMPVLGSYIFTEVESHQATVDVTFPEPGQFRIVYREMQRVPGGDLRAVGEPIEFRGTCRLTNSGLLLGRMGELSGIRYEGRLPGAHPTVPVVYV